MEMLKTMDIKPYETFFIKFILMDVFLIFLLVAIILSGMVFILQFINILTFKLPDFVFVLFSILVFSAIIATIRFVPYLRTNSTVFAVFSLIKNQFGADKITLKTQFPRPSVIFKGSLEANATSSAQETPHKYYYSMETISEKYKTKTECYVDHKNYSLSVNVVDWHNNSNSFQLTGELKKMYKVMTKKIIEFHKEIIEKIATSDKKTPVMKQEPEVRKETPTRSQEVSKKDFDSMLDYMKKRKI